MLRNLFSLFGPGASLVKSNKRGGEFGGRPRSPTGGGGFRTLRGIAPEMGSFGITDGTAFRRRSDCGLVMAGLLGMGLFAFGFIVISVAISLGSGRSEEGECECKSAIRTTIECNTQPDKPLLGSTYACFRCEFTLVAYSKTGAGARLGERAFEVVRDERVLANPPQGCGAEVGGGCGPKSERTACWITPSTGQITTHELKSPVVIVVIGGSTSLLGLTLFLTSALSLFWRHGSGKQVSGQTKGYKPRWEAKDAHREGEGEDEEDPCSPLCSPTSDLPQHHNPHPTLQSTHHPGPPDQLNPLCFQQETEAPHQRGHHTPSPQGDEERDNWSPAFVLAFDSPLSPQY